MSPPESPSRVECSLRPPCRVRDGYRATERLSIQVDGIQLQVVDQCLEVQDQCIQAEVMYFALRKAVATGIVLDDEARTGQRFEERSG